MKERAYLIELVKRIVDVAGTEAEIDGWLDELQAEVPYPGVTDLIYHDVERSPEEIVDLALNYRPTRLGP